MIHCWGGGESKTDLDELGREGGRGVVQVTVLDTEGVIAGFPEESM